MELKIQTTRPVVVVVRTSCYLYDLCSLCASERTGQTVARPRNESPASKAARKKAVKAERSDRRKEKKERKEVFGGEMRKAKGEEERNLKLKSL